MDAGAVAALGCSPGNGHVDERQVGPGERYMEHAVRRSLGDLGPGPAGSLDREVAARRGDVEVTSRIQILGGPRDRQRRVAGQLHRVVFAAGVGGADGLPQGAIDAAHAGPRDGVRGVGDDENGGARRGWAGREAGQDADRDQRDPPDPQHRRSLLPDGSDRNEWDG